MYFFVDGKPIVSMGGLNVAPEVSLSGVNINEISMLVLPGGTAWESGANTEIIGFVEELFLWKVSVAAIYAATVFLANLRYLNNIQHKSNDLAF